jgi:hypothetical protein
MLAEGYDERSIRAVVMFRPARWIGNYLQRIGRGGRLAEGFEPTHECSHEERRREVSASCKPDYLVVDVVGASLVHKVKQIDLGDVLCPVPNSAVREAVRSAAARNEGSVILAESEIKRRMAADRRLRQSISAEKVEYTADDIDLFAVKKAQQGSQQKAPNGVAWSVIATLKREGIRFNNLDKKETMVLFLKIKAARSGRISPKMISYLTKYGEQVVNWHPWKASIIGDLIRQRRFQPRDYALTRDRWKLTHTPEGWRIIVAEPSGRELRVGPAFHDEASTRKVIVLCLEEKDRSTPKEMPKETPVEQPNLL